MIQIKFISKSDFETFKACMGTTFVLTKDSMNYLQFYNANAFLKVLQKKHSDILFSGNKKFSIKIDVNQFSVYEYMWECTVPYWKNEKFIVRYNFLVQCFEQGKKGFELLENKNFLSLKYDNNNILTMGL